MAVQLKEGAWRTRSGEKCVIKDRYYGIGSFFRWSSDDGAIYADDGRYSFSTPDHPCDIIGPWVDEPDPGEGYRLATEKDVGAKVFGLSDGKEWHDFDGYLTLCSDGWANYRAPPWKYARVPVAAKPDDKPQFVPGEWYAVGGEKQCYVGQNPINGRSIFSNEEGVIVGIDKINAISPWVDPPAFRMCSAVVHGQRIELVKPTAQYGFYDDRIRRYDPSELSDIRWHEDSN